MRAMRAFLVFCLVFVVCGIWVFFGWPQIWRNPSIPPQVPEVYAATASAFPGTTAGAQDTSYVSADCSHNMAWDGTGSPGNASTSDDSYIAEDGVALDNGDTSDELQFSNFGFSLSNVVSIDGVVVFLRFR